MDDAASARTRRRFLAAMGLPLTLVACNNHPAPLVTASAEPSAASTATTTGTMATASAPTTTGAASASAAPTASALASAAPTASASASTTTTNTARVNTTKLPVSQGPRVWSVGSREICMGARDTQAAGVDPATGCGNQPGAVVWGGDVARPCGPCAFGFSPTVTRSERAKRPDACCYSGSSPSGPGRMLRLDGATTTASCTARSDWREARDSTSAIDVHGLDDATRASRAAQWANDALLEHASVAAFALAALRLLAHGAPPQLVADCHRAAIDEIAHAKACFEVASAYAGAPCGPGPLDAMATTMRAEDAPRLQVAMTLEAFAVETLIDGCLGETIASFEARDASAAATDPAIASIRARIADDEERHAELAWRTLAWACAAGGAHVVDALRTAQGALARACEESSTRRAVIASIVLPCLAALLAHAAGA